MRELGRTSLGEKNSSLAALAWCHPRFPQADMLVATKNSSVLSTASTR